MTRCASIVLSLIALSAGAATASAAPTPEQIARGKYLVTIMGCNDCHTPFKLGANGPEPDMSRMLTGHPQDFKIAAAPTPPTGPWGWTGAVTNTAFAGPWGVSFTANLTPDPETGLGKWTPETFVKALRTGRHMGVGRPILPPMPWRFIGTATDEDLNAIFAFLQSLPPVKNKVPQPIEPTEAAPASGGASRP